MFDGLKMRVYEWWHREDIAVENYDKENREIVAEINRKVGAQKSVFTRIVKKINSQRETIYSETLRNYVDVFNKIQSNAELVPNPKLEIIAKVNLQKIGVPELLDSNGNRLWNKSYSEEMSMEMKREVEIRKLELLKIKSSNKFLHTLSETMDILDKLMKKCTRQLEMMISEEGNNYLSYSKEEKAFVRTSVNLARALTYFISETYITEKGNLRAKYKRFTLDIPRSEADIMKYFGEDI